MRICYIAHPDLTHTRRWVDWFARRGHEVCVIADFPQREPWTGRQVFDLSRRWRWTALRYLPWAAWSRRIIHDWRPDILHAHRVNSAGWLGAAAGFHPFVVTPWGSDLYLHPQRSALARRLARFVLRQADLVTTDSADLGRTAVTLGARSDRVHLVQWGVDLDLFHPGIDSADLRRKLDIPAQSPVVLSPRAMGEVYNIHDIVASLPAVRKAAPEVIYLLRDYHTVQPYRQQIVAQIEALDVKESVRWLGVLPRWEDNPQVYNLAQAAVSVPESDGTPVSVLEAMACGVPVVVSDLPSLREWIQDREDGRLVPAGDVEAISQALIEVITNPEVRERYRRRGIEVVQARANHQLEMEKMESLYEGLLR